MTLVPYNPAGGCHRCVHDGDFVHSAGQKFLRAWILDA